MTHFGNLLAPSTLLPVDPAVALLDAGDDPAAVAAAHPTSSAAWAALAEAAFRGSASEVVSGRHGSSAGADATADAVTAYAYARTGYHRGLDALRRAGWKGQGPIPWAHEANRGFLRALHLLAAAAAAIGEQDEAARCRQLLQDSDPEAAAELAG